MATHDPTKVYDGHTELIGVNGHQRPLKIPRNQVHRAINAAFRGDEAKPRPGIKAVPLSISSSITLRDVNEGRWQGGAVYTPDDGASFLTFMKGGRLFKIDVDTGVVSDISIVGSVNLLKDVTAPAVGSSTTIYVDDIANFSVSAEVRVDGYRYKVVDKDSGFTDLTAPFVVPAVGATVVATVTDTTGFVVGAVILVSEAWYEVDTIGGLTSITLKNINDTAANRIIGELLIWNALVVTNLEDMGGTVHVAGSKVEFFDVNAGTGYRAWNCQAEKWQIWQDGVSRALIFDGATARRAGSLEVPSGTAMAYGWGRLWVARNNGKQYVAGDLLYGPTGTAPEQRRDSVLKFTENTYIAEGGAFQIPENAGRITGMGFLASLDNSLGQGPLQIFTTVGGFTVQANVNRSDWKTVNADSIPIVAVSLKERGLESDRTLAAINSDYYYRSGDGVRSFQLSRREFGTWWNTPISKEVDWVLKYDPQPLLEFASGVYFDRRYICTAGPQQSGRGIIHKGLVALDLEQQSWLSAEAPQWDGLWTAVYAYQIVTGKFKGKDRAFIFSENGEGEFELYELTQDDHEDFAAGMTQGTKIRWALEFGSLTFPRDEGHGGLFDLKELHGGEMNVSNLEDEVTFKLRFRPDGMSCWLPWHWWKKCATLGACESSLLLNTCPDWSPGQPQMLPPMGIPRPPQYVGPNNERLDINYAWQIRLDVRGYCVFKALRLAATTLPQPTTVKPDEPLDA